MADDFENFTTFTASTVHDPHQSTEAWGNWPAFNEEPPPISDDSEDEEFGIFETARGNEPEEIDSPNSLPPLPDVTEIFTPDDNFNIEELSRDIEAIGMSLTPSLPETPARDVSLVSSTVTQPSVDVHATTLGIKESETDSSFADFNAFIEAPKISSPRKGSGSDEGQLEDLSHFSSAAAQEDSLEAAPSLPTATKVNCDSTKHTGPAMTSVHENVNTFENEKIQAFQMNSGFANFTNLANTENSSTTFGQNNEFGDFTTGQLIQTQLQNGISTSVTLPSSSIQVNNKDSEVFGHYSSTLTPNQGNGFTDSEPKQNEFTAFQAQTNDFGDFSSTSPVPPPNTSNEAFGGFSSSLPVSETSSDTAKGSEAALGTTDTTRLPHGKNVPASDENDDDFGDFGAFEGEQLVSSDADKPSTGLVEVKDQIKDVRMLLESNFPTSTSNPLNENGNVATLNGSLLSGRLWSTVTDVKTADDAVSVFQWSHSGIQDTFYSATHVDPALAPAFIPRPTRSALQLENFGFLSKFDKEEFSSISSPLESPAIPSNPLLDLSFSPPASPRQPNSNVTDAFTFDADLVGLDWTAPSTAAEAILSLDTNLVKSSSPEHKTDSQGFQGQPLSEASSGTSKASKTLPPQSTADDEFSDFSGFTDAQSSTLPDTVPVNEFQTSSSAPSDVRMDPTSSNKPLPIAATPMAPPSQSRTDALPPSTSVQTKPAAFSSGVNEDKYSAFSSMTLSGPSSTNDDFGTFTSNSKGVVDQVAEDKYPVLPRAHIDPSGGGDGDFGTFTSSEIISTTNSEQPGDDKYAAFSNIQMSPIKSEAAELNDFTAFAAAVPEKNIGGEPPMGDKYSVLSSTQVEPSSSSADRVNNFSNTQVTAPFGTGKSSAAINNFAVFPSTQSSLENTGVNANELTTFTSVPVGQLVSSGPSLNSSHSLFSANSGLNVPAAPNAFTSTHLGNAPSLVPDDNFTDFTSFTTVAQNPPTTAYLQSTSTAGLTVASPHNLSREAHQLFDELPDVRFMLSNVLIKPVKPF